MKPAKLWIVLGRPTSLPGALIAAYSLGDRFPGGIHLLRDQSQWWDRATWQPFAKAFAAIHAFPRVKTCRGLVDLPRLYRQTTARKSSIAALPIDPDNDVLLCLASVMGLANAAVSAHPAVFKVLSIGTTEYNNLRTKPDRVRFRFTTSSWLQNRLVEPLAGVERTLHFKPRINPGGDGVRLVRLQKEPGEIYDAVIALSNNGRDLPNESEIPVVPSRFPSIAELAALAPGALTGLVDHPHQAGADQSRGNRSGRVIFFGTPFLLIHNLPPAQYVEHLNRALDFIRRNYPGRDLIYRPHPFETGESNRLDLHDFRVEDDREAAELYFMRYYGEIEAVFSVSSTVSRTALNNGFNAYSLWRCFPFPETAAKYFERTMGEVPREFDIVDLTKPPVAYQQHRQPEANTRSFAQAVKLAVAQRAATPR